LLIQIDELRELDRRCVFFVSAARLRRRNVRFDRCRRFFDVLLNASESFVHLFKFYIHRFVRDQRRQQHDYATK
jgi:hypothetical protein